MPIPVRLRLMRWLLRVSTPEQPHAPPSPPQRRQCGGATGSGQQQGRGRRAARSVRGAYAATCAPQPPQPAARSELLMARNTNRSVPLLTLMRHADSDGRDWSLLVAELCAHMAIQDYAAADSKKVEDDPLAAPNQHGPAPQAAATASTAAAAGLVSDLLFHLRSRHYDGRLLDELAAEQIAEQ
ncbi:hypothetical protein GPECTOR_3g457 [Gonium pectorale]|uniref:Uncharacterized protein n=1 Tax=Gonium pectorale TaxID=33097 RepID=A0A150GZW7_GONPE|nr:hypothetical protein GPECTOR_3g457 [Gonium pectorale]|eukprot:KXZ55324.1 hypothetical protein GPECTOR_3g457 [Gonium pectorale]